MLVSARNNQFQFNFPRTFVPKEISDKYKHYLNRMPGSMITEAIDFFNYGIQSINLPGPSYDPVEQLDRESVTRRYRSSFPNQQNYDKTLSVTFNAFDGYINYWMAVDLYNYYYNTDEQKYLPDPVGIKLLDGEGNVLVTCHLKKLLFTSVSALDLNFSSNTIEFQTFDLTFTYDYLDIDVNLQ